MKKIGVITFHFANNVGAVLQCLATSEQLKKMGAQPFVVNYRPKYHVSKFAAWRPVFYLTKEKTKHLKRKGVKGISLAKGALKMYLGTLWENRRYSEHAKKTERFSSFVKSFLSESPVYKTLDELQADPPEAYGYICGSDQIWNKALTCGEFDRAYFLKFGGKDIRRVAYAPSMEETDIIANSDDFLECIGGLDEIYFRESVDCDKLEQLTGNPYVSVKDPTLFHTMKDYAPFESDVNVPERFVFVYTVLKTPIVGSVADKISGGLNAPVIDGSVYDYIRCNGREYDRFCGPGEFLSYIKKADFVITNSFHGTVFAILYHKNFVTVSNDKRNTRIENLLASVGLSDRLIRKDDLNRIDTLPAIDYDNVDAVLENSRVRDAELLRKALFD